MISVHALLSNPATGFFVRFSTYYDYKALVASTSNRKSRQSFAILVGGFLRNVCGNCGSRWLLVPASGLEPVTHELLIETRRIAAFTVTVCRPETAGVGSQHLIHKGKSAVFIEAELEFGVGDNDAASCCVLHSSTVERHGDDTKFRSEEHTSELQSRENLVCRLLLEKKNKIAKHAQHLLLR